MQPQKHAKLMEILQIAVIIASFILFFSLCVSAVVNNASIAIIIFMLWILVVLITIISWGIPIRCPNPFCIGRMVRKNTYASEFKAKLTYKCQMCKQRYVTIIFQIPQVFPLSDNSS